MEWNGPLTEERQTIFRRENGRAGDREPPAVLVEVVTATRAAQALPALAPRVQSEHLAYDEYCTDWFMIEAAGVDG